MVKRKKTEFGEFLVNEIKKADLSQEQFYKAVGIAKPYFYDMLNAAPPPPDIQEKMVDVLNNKTGIDLIRTRMLFDLAARGRNEIPADIRKNLLDNSAEWNKIRELLEAVLTVK